MIFIYIIFFVNAASLNNGSFQIKELKHTNTTTVKINNKNYLIGKSIRMIKMPLQTMANWNLEHKSPLIWSSAIGEEKSVPVTIRNSTFCKTDNSHEAGSLVPSLRGGQIRLNKLSDWANYQALTSLGVKFILI